MVNKSQNFVNVIFERPLRTLLGISLDHLLLVASKIDRFFFTLELKTQQPSLQLWNELYKMEFIECYAGLLYQQMQKWCHF